MSEPSKNPIPSSEPSPSLTRQGTTFKQVTAGESGDSHLESTLAAPPTKRIALSGLAASGWIQSFASNFKGPIPFHETLYREVLINEIDNVSRACYEQILAVLYPDGDFLQNGIISVEDFLLVTQYIFKSRIDMVYASASGRRPSDRVPLAKSFEIPKAIAEAINSYGLIVIHSNSLRVIPCPPAEPADKTQRIGNLVTHLMLESFSRFIILARNRGIITLMVTSSLTDGTAAWLLAARATFDRHTIATGQTVSVTPWGQFPGWTPADGLLSVMLCNGYDGLVFRGCKEFYFCMDSVSDAMSSRHSFGINA